MEKTNWINIKDQPLPTCGLIIVSVTTKWADELVPISFSTVVYGDELGPMDKTGDSFMYEKDITHWQKLPKPILPFTNN